ncbi:restriction endonuclease [Phocaeicola plebeius]|nr:restriction endonuclease [Phocaeicola plebeius]MCI6051315.1 restriction endonuclease [Phocaeicola plebeius]MDD6912659.1 restriction endonuclease [Phocaeicola plebeius]MDY5977547.1 restriction endonuclease [Phocaeicola plebeius]
MFQSTTKGVLHFEDLSPQQFEDLYRNILHITGDYQDIRAYGIKGSDDGVDIFCTEKATGLNFFIQCKRYKNLHLADLKKIVNRIIEGNNDYQGHVISVVATCDISRDAREGYKSYALDKGFAKAFFIGLRELDDMLHLEQFDRLKEHFLGVAFNQEKIARQKLKYAEEGELLVTKLLRKIDFPNPKIQKDIIKNPSRKFNYSKVIIKSIYDNVYPFSNKDDQPSSWFISFLHDIYNNGIQLHLDAFRYEEIVVDCCGNWMLKKDFNNCQDQSDILELKVNIIGRIPYYNIANIKMNGDDFYSEPIIICVFDEISGPFTEICYEFHDYATNKRIMFEKGQRAWMSEYDFYELKQKVNISNIKK